MNLKELIRGAELPITLRHETWLSTHSNPEYSPEALEFARKALSHEVGGSRSRSTSYRASGLGGCERKQQFSALKYDGITDIDSQLANIFGTGHFMHLKWQMAGLTEGWLKEAEIPVEDASLDFGGTMDGIVWDDSLFEFKTINSRGFSNVCEFGPKKDHIYQAHGYMYLAKLQAVSFVYEDKGTGDWREFRMERDEELVDEILAKITRLNELKEEKKLPEPLSSCIDREGYMYRHCPYRSICLETQ